MRRTLTFGLSLTLALALAIPAARAAGKRPVGVTETKPEEAKAEEKKEEKKKPAPAVAAKPAETKPAEAKPAEVKPAEAKAPAAAPVPADAKAAVTTPPAPEAPKPPAPEPAERVIEKSEADFQYKLTIRPGNLKLDRVADVRLQVWKKLDRPDPITGDRAPLVKVTPVAEVKPPEAWPEKGKKPPPVVVSRYSLAPLANPGEFGFHFTPAADGLYEVTFTGTEAKSEDNDGAKFDVRFRLGAGTAAAETEQSQGAAAKKTARRPVGGDSEQQTKLEKLMEEVGQRYLGLEAMLQKAPAKGPHADAAAEARAIGALFSQVKGQVPSDHRANAGEFDKLALGMAEKFEVVAVAAEGKDRNAPKAALSSLEIQGCNQCHAKYRYGVTDNLSEWPKFRQKLKQ
jgi:hypothetical protein